MPERNAPGPRHVSPSRGQTIPKAMNQDSIERRLHDWQTAEITGDNDAADEAFARLYATAVPRRAPAPAFVAATVQAVASATARDARRARWVRAALGSTAAVVGLGLLYLGSGVLLSMFSAAVVGGLNLIVSTIVWMAEGGQARTGVWSALGGLGRAAAAFVAEPRVTVVILGFQAVAAAALVVMHRLLGRDREWIE
jgi:hypothetical protein